MNEEAQTLDNRKVPCATGLIRAADVIEGLASGTVLDILTRDRFAPTEVALWAEREGHALLATTREGMWPARHYRLRIRKGAAPG